MIRVWVWVWVKGGGQGKLSPRKLNNWKFIGAINRPPDFERVPIMQAETTKNM